VAAPDVLPMDIMLHERTVRTLQRYQGVMGAVRSLKERIAGWFDKHGHPPMGSKAWEAKLEIEKLEYMTRAMMEMKTGAGITKEQAAELDARIGELEAQLEQHRKTLDEMDTDPGRGYIAAEGGSNRRKPKIGQVIKDKRSKYEIIEIDQEKGTIKAKAIGRNAGMTVTFPIERYGTDYLPKSGKQKQAIPSQPSLDQPIRLANDWEFPAIDLFSTVDRIGGDEVAKARKAQEEKSTSSNESDNQSTQATVVDPSPFGSPTVNLKSNRVHEVGKTGTRYGHWDVKDKQGNVLWGTINAGDKSAKGRSYPEFKKQLEGVEVGELFTKIFNNEKLPAGKKQNCR
jgi:hypothetical protein